MYSGLQKLARENLLKPVALQNCDFQESRQHERRSHLLQESRKVW